MALQVEHVEYDDVRYERYKVKRLIDNLWPKGWIVITLMC